MDIVIFRMCLFWITFWIHFLDFVIVNNNTYKDNNHDISDIPKKNLRHALFLLYLINLIPMLISFRKFYKNKKYVLYIIYTIFVYLVAVFISDAIINGMFTFGKEDKIENNSIRNINLYSFAIINIIILLLHIVALFISTFF